MVATLKVKMNNLDPRIKFAITEIQDQIDEDFTVWSRSGNGEYCQLYSMKWVSQLILISTLKVG